MRRARWPAATALALALALQLGAAVPAVAADITASGVVLKKGGPLRRPGAGVHRRLRRQGLYHPPGEQRHRRAGSGFPDL